MQVVSNVTLKEVDVQSRRCNTAEENPSLNLRTSKLPINIGVTYSPNKNIVKTVVIEIPDSMPRLTSKPDDYATDGSDMFVDLSPLDSAKQFVRKPADQ